MELSKQITQYVCDYLLDQRATILPDTSLFEGRVLDSMKLVELIGFLEETYQIKIKPMEIVVENLDTIKSMVRFVKEKQK